MSRNSIIDHNQYWKEYKDRRAQYLDVHFKKIIEKSK